ncbi:MAG: hypothetical protein ACTH3G_02065, partial [Citricoccus sp.]
MLSLSPLAESLSVLTAAGAAAESTAEPTGIPDTENVPDSVREGAEGAVNSLGPFWGILSTVAIAVVIAVAVVVIAWLLMNTVLRRKPGMRGQVAKCRIPVLSVAVLLAARIALGLTAAGYPWFAGVNFLLMVGIVGALAWLALRVVLIVEERLLGKYASEGVDDR